MRDITFFLQENNRFILTPTFPPVGLGEVCRARNSFISSPFRRLVDIDAIVDTINRLNPPLILQGLLYSGLISSYEEEEAN
jgi:hypothetical protein